MGFKIHLVCWGQSCNFRHNVVKSKCPPLLYSLLWSKGVSWNTSVYGIKVIGPLPRWQEWDGCCYKKCNNRKEVVPMAVFWRKSEVTNINCRMSCPVLSCPVVSVAVQKAGASVHPLLSTCWQWAPQDGVKCPKNRLKGNFEPLLHFDIPWDYNWQSPAWGAGKGRVFSKQAGSFHRLMQFSPAGVASNDVLLLLFAGVDGITYLSGDAFCLLVFCDQSFLWTAVTLESGTRQARASSPAVRRWRAGTKRSFLSYNL